ncbi:MAG TPA: topoisomerase C-terminal repeat-containing protein, partial [Steroidobacteraceae bacterium]|nr:topoisomerase C-terminal repeat-containing protein [Steroidobacteraceae bacterium]
YVSLKIDDPYEITPERALEVIREKEIADANRLILDFPDAGIQVLNGRYGPYITDKSRNAKIPKDKDPKSLTLEECQALLAAAPVRTFGKWGRKNGKAAAKGAAANGKAASSTPKAAAADAAATKPRGKAAPVALAAKAAKAAASKKAPAQPPLNTPAKAAVKAPVKAPGKAASAEASKAKAKAKPKAKKSSVKKQP